MRKYLFKRAEWKFQHKYSIRIGRSCGRDQKEVSAILAKVDKLYPAVGTFMGGMGMSNIKALDDLLNSKQNDCTQFATPLPAVPIPPEFDDTKKPTKGPALDGPGDEDELEAGIWDSVKVAGGFADKDDVATETPGEKYWRLRKERAHREQIRKNKLRVCGDRRARIQAKLAVVKSEYNQV